MKNQNKTLADYYGSKHKQAHALWILLLLTSSIWYFGVYKMVIPVFQNYLDVPVKIITITKQAEASVKAPATEVELKWTKIIIENKNSLAYKNNNPGNLRYAQQKNATRGLGGFARFETPMAGLNGLISQIKLDQSRNLSLKSFIEKYAPPNDGNDTHDYIYMVSSWLDVSPNVNINKLDTFKLATYIMKIESGGMVE